MKYFLVLIVIVLSSWLFVPISNAQNQGFTSNSANQTLVSVTGTSTQVLAYDTTRTGWCVYNEGTSSNGVRCETGLYNGNGPVTSPTSSIGFLIPGGQTQAWCMPPSTPPQLSLYCAATGSTVNVDVWASNH